MKPVLDTKFLIDYLPASKPARDELAPFPDARITWIEVMASVTSEKEEVQVREFLNSVETIPLDEHIAEAAVRIRREHRLRLPDALIWAGAKTSDA